MNKLKDVSVFVIHQIIAAVGIAMAAALLIPFTFDLLTYVNPRLFTGHNAHFLLTQVPYFPMQMILALWSGWSFYRRYRHRSMLWVWVLPLLILCYALLTDLILAPDQMVAVAQGVVSHSVISHYFGRECSVDARCTDQLLITMPFYSSVAYSIGALAALKTVRSKPDLTSVAEINSTESAAASDAGLL